MKRIKLGAQFGWMATIALAAAVGAGAVSGVAQAAASADAPASGASAPQANLKLAQAGVATGTATAAATGTPVELQGIEVTGSRIKQPTLTGSAALQAIDSKELKLEGTINVDSLLSNVPSAFTTSSSNSSTENNISTVDLRGLGANRTLVLIDGKRVVPGDPTALGGGATDVNGVNINFIPTALIERVDVLTGGASAVYGSDAISGVVNFIMKKDFDGFAVDGQWNRTDSGDGTQYNSSLIWGSNFAGGAGNVTLYAGYTRLDTVPLIARDYNRCVFFPDANGKQTCLGSSAIPAGLFFGDDPNQPLGMIDPNGSRTIVPFNGNTFNFALTNLLVRPDKRYQLGGFAHRSFGEHFDVYGSAMFMQDRSGQQDAPSPTFFQDFTRTNCDNPLLSAQEQQYLCPNPGQTQASATIGRRLVELGPRVTDVRNTEYRIVFGLRGAIADGWSYDVSAQRSENSVSQAQFGHVSKQRINQALQVTTDANGNPVCIDPSNGCVPLDLFKFEAITPAQASFIGATALEQASTVEEVATASVTGDLGRYRVRSPFAQRGVQVAGGFEYRRETLDFRPDASLQSGDATDEGGAIPAVSGRFKVTDGFGELQLPIVENLPFAKLLQLDTAYRLSNYKIATRSSDLYTHAYKFGLRYDPIPDVGIRGSWNRAVRAPDIQELFLPDAVRDIVIVDPCSGTTPAATLAQCERTGVTPAQFGNILQCPALECNVKLGGNNNLNAEKSITRQAGIVLTPRFLKGFTGTIDYYQITLAGAIGAIPPLSVLGACLQSGAFCDQIQRGQGGRLFGDTATAFINDTDLNTGFIKTRGVDFNLDYNRYLADLGLGDNGRVSFTFVGTYVNAFERKNTPTSPQFDCAGLFGITCGNPHPRWRHRARLTWENPMGAIPGYALSLQWRYIGEASLDANRTANQQLNPTGAPFDAVDAKAPTKNYLDLAMTYRLPLESQDVTLRFGINNLGAEGPAILTVAANPTGVTQIFNAGQNTVGSLYDTLGRVFFLGVNASFR
ncbi:MAG: TonB-dependent receptor [Gammaproteobacteria bacterium]|nr:TonB-dependent receptor [Gammaproteobacteria bacterium]